MSLRIRPAARPRHLWSSLCITALLMGGGGAVLALISLRLAPETAGQVIGFLAPAPVSTQQRELPAAPPASEPPPMVDSTLPEEEYTPPAEASLVTLPELPPTEQPSIPELPELLIPRRAAARPAPAPRSAAPPVPPAVAAAEAAHDYTPPAYRHAPHPPYPAAMRESRVQGSVRLRIFLDEHGAPQRVEIAESSGHAEFDSTARAWVLRHWEFTPAQRGGNAVPSTVVTRVQFVLN